MLMLGWWTHFRCESDKDHMVVGWVYQYGNVEVEESFYHESQSGKRSVLDPVDWFKILIAGIDILT